MSQPPKPPQPPQGVPPEQPAGGFGAPQDPTPTAAAPQDAPGPTSGPTPTVFAPGGPAPAPGFGAPQGTAPGFGAPPAMPPRPQDRPPAAPQPAAQPAYGYPQAPPPPPGAPQAPPAPPGAPLAPPPGASQPPPPPGAPHIPPSPAGGYGYPGQAGPGAPTPVQPFPQYGGGGYPPPPAPPGGGSKKRMAVIVSAVTALVLVAGGGVWYATTGGDDKDDKTTNSATKGGKQEKGKETGGKGGSEDQKPKEGKLLFGADQPVVDDSRSAAGMWVTDKVFAKSDLDKVVGYGLSGGKQWEIPLPGDICSAPRHVTEDGRTAVVVAESPPSSSNRYGGPCNQIVALDLNNGKKLWQKSIKVGDRTVAFDEVTVGGGTVAAGSIQGGAAWTMDGKELWKPKPEDLCKDDGYGGGSKLVAVRRCGDYERPQMKIQTLDPVSGKAKSTFNLPNGVDGAHVVSTDPLVIGVKVGDHSGTGVSDFMAIDDSGSDGKLRSKISTENGKYQPRCSSSGVESCYKLAVGKDKLYLPTDDHQTGKSGEVGRVNEIVAFDLSNGQTKGKVDGRVSSTLVPLGVDKDGAVIGYQTAGWRDGGTVVSIDPQTLAAKVLLKNPVATQQVENQISPLFEQAVWAQGRLYLGRKYLHKPSPFAGGKEYVAMIWGAE
ncbi:PQQ-binding-like beta-propeller repeat protein [Streptomyces mobaraensis NBRC 13819 = DSM 40847]|nr:PQQ-binding-like beta-propeller repeat protein [Streptomyces mobaraensis]QTT74183.1 PQQ-binding-like beta-propeller repeat protein [Streptomyces mobaraensis NBRC 13819 = DSM 40847]